MNKEMTMTQKTKKVPCEVYSRIVGYLRPVQNWNKGKQQEFEDRRTYHLEPATEQECTSRAG
jgi:anaerobic ribonucleoside-triphosphate reductase